jgi:Divergent InlB B-repeat domain
MCDQRKISGTDYKMYDNNTELTCHAILNPGYEFSLWSSDLTPSNSPNSADNSFKVSHYGYLTANFRQASTVTIPTDLLYGVILGPTIGSITAWLIPFFWDRMRKSKDLQDVMIHIGIIDRTYETALRNRGECLDLLRRKRADITRLDGCTSNNKI